MPALERIGAVVSIGIFRESCFAPLAGGYSIGKCGDGGVLAWGGIQTRNRALIEDIQLGDAINEIKKNGDALLVVWFEDFPLGAASYETLLDNFPLVSNRWVWGKTPWVIICENL